MEAFSIISIISIALLGSFGHCIGMCGGIVVAYTSMKVKADDSKAKQIIAHLAYGFGRVTSYTFLGAIFGLLGSVIAFTNSTKALLFFVTGVLMVLVGLSLLGKIKFLTSIEHSCSKSPFYQKTFKKVLGSSSFSSFYILGILNGLLPCGFVYFFAITAAATASVFWGAFVMFIFGLCTIPALFILGFFAGLFKQSKLRDIFIKIASILVIIMGIMMLYKGFMFYTNQTMNHEMTHEMKH